MKKFALCIAFLLSIFFIFAEQSVEQDINTEVEKKELSIFEEFIKSFTKSSRNDEFLIPAKSEIYDQITLICAEQKRTATITNKPLSIRELKSYLFALDYEKLSDSSKKIYDSILAEFNSEYFSFKTAAVQFGVSPTLTPEFYLRANNDIPWVYDYSQKKHFLDIPIRLGFSKYVASEIIPTVQLNHTTANSRYNFMNFPLAFNDDSFTLAPSTVYNAYEWRQPKIGYVSTGFQFGNTPSGLQVVFGRMPVSYGNSTMQSIILSEEFDTDWFGSLQFYAPAVKYNVSVMQVGAESYYYSHQVQIRPFRNFQVGAMEGVFVTAPFELRYFNPAAVFHQFSYWADYIPKGGESYDNVCGLVGINAEFVPFKNLRLYGDLVITEMQQIAELVDDESCCTPNAFGFQVGTDYTVPTTMFDGSYWKITLEYLYTSHWLYLRQNFSSSLSQHFVEGMDSYYTWLGSPEGPDSMIGLVSLKYEVPQKWNATLSYRFSAHGENYFNAYEKYPGVVRGRDISERLELALATTPSGVNPIFTNAVTLAGGYRWNSRIATNGQVSAIYVINNHHKAGYNVFSVEAVISTEIKLF